MGAAGDADQNVPDGAPDEAAPHQGPLDAPDATGSSGSLVSGPGITLRLALGKGGLIRTARFELVQFDVARQVAEILCGLLEGATVFEASRLTSAALAKVADTPAVSPAVRIPHFALSDALLPFVRPKPPPGAHITCTCFGIATDEIRRVIQIERCRSVDDVRRHLPATRGCGTCRPDVEDLIAEGRAD